jgi:glycosyltransferase involved in cell wall biosynthesis
MKRKILSVIILTYNSSRTIEKCLDSLENQTNKNFVALIVDDDSTDNTLEIVNNFAENSKFKIYCFRNGRHNISRGRNIGIINATTRYVAFLDSDAYADKNWVKNITNEFYQDKDLSFIGGREIQIFTNNFSRGVSISSSVIEKLTSNFWSVRGANCALNKSKLKGICFNEKFIHYEESELIYRLEKKFKWKYSKDIVIHHESRSTPRRFFTQMYKYGIWRIYFSFYSEKFRLVDFYPSVLILLTIILLLFNICSLLIIPIFSLLESVFVLFYMKAQIKYFPYIFLGWLIKNIGWGAGTIMGLSKVIFNNKIIQNLKEN